MSKSKRSGVYRLAFDLERRNSDLLRSRDLLAEALIRAIAFEPCCGQAHPDCLKSWQAVKEFTGAALAAVEGEGEK